MCKSRGALVGITGILATLAAFPVCAAPIAITEVQALSFTPALSGTSVNVVTMPTDSRAAIFDITGTVNVAVTASIVEASIEIFLVGGSTNPAPNRIMVTNWTYGGAVAADGTAFMDGNGELNNVRVGATIQVNANDSPGDFLGTATFRLVYQ